MWTAYMCKVVDYTIISFFGNTRVQETLTYAKHHRNPKHPDARDRDTATRALLQ